jgi:hypothetical protein
MSYEAFVMRTARNQRTPRTMDEAFRTANYAASITKFEPRHKHELANLMTFVSITTMIVASGYLLTTLFDLFIESIR